MMHISKRFHKKSKKELLDPEEKNIVVNTYIDNYIRTRVTV